MKFKVLEAMVISYPAGIVGVLRKADEVLFCHPFCLLLTSACPIVGRRCCREVTVFLQARCRQVKT